MHVYNEIVDGRLSTFERHTLDENGRSIASTSTKIPLHETHLDGRRLFLLYDDDMRVIPGTYAYLNVHLIGKSANSRRKAAGQLRRFYCFLAMAGVTEESLDEALLAELCQFLRGVGQVTSEYSLKTHRCNNNVNEHLATFRKYLSFRGVGCPPLQRARVVYEEAAYAGVPTKVQRTRYVNNLPGKKYCERGVPKYVSPEEFRKLLRLARDAGDDTAEMVMRLTYVFGLRLGEALGLTIEDITEVLDGGDYVPVLVIRNRASDRDFQHAKGKRHPISAAEYTSQGYIDSRDEVVIDYDTYDRLVRYVNETHGRAMRERPDDYAKGRADVVSTNDAPETNQYVFLNRYGRPLSGQTWGNHLRRYFERAEIPLNWDRKRDSLSHRFRHGFAMFHAHFRPNPVGALELQEMLRHKCLSSTMVYFNLTAQDELKIKEAFQKDLHEMIPELKAQARG